MPHGVKVTRSQRSLKCHVGEVDGGWSTLNVDYKAQGRKEEDCGLR